PASIRARLLIRRPASRLTFRPARSLAGGPPGARARHVIRGPARLLIFRPARALPGVRTGGPLLVGGLIGPPTRAGVAGRPAPPRRARLPPGPQRPARRPPSRRWGPRPAPSQRREPPA